MSCEAHCVVVVVHDGSDMRVATWAARCNAARGSDASAARCANCNHGFATDAARTFSTLRRSRSDACSRHSPLRCTATITTDVSSRTDALQCASASGSRATAAAVT